MGISELFLSSTLSPSSSCCSDEELCKIVRTCLHSYSVEITRTIFLRTFHILLSPSTHISSLQLFIKLFLFLSIEFPTTTFELVPEIAIISGSYHAVIETLNFIETLSEIAQACMDNIRKNLIIQLLDKVQGELIAEDGSVPTVAPLLVNEIDTERENQPQWLRVIFSAIQEDEDDIDFNQCIAALRACAAKGNDDNTMDALNGLTIDESDEEHTVESLAVDLNSNEKLSAIRKHLDRSREKCFYFQTKPENVPRKHFPPVKRVRVKRLYFRTSRPQVRTWRPFRAYIFNNTSRYRRRRRGPGPVIEFHERHGPMKRDNRSKIEQAKKKKQQREVMQRQQAIHLLRKIQRAAEIHAMLKGIKEDHHQQQLKSIKKGKGKGKQTKQVISNNSVVLYDPFSNTYTSC